MSHGLVHRIINGRDFIAKAPVGSRAGYRAVTDSRKQHLILARELIASKFYQFLLGDAAPEFVCLKNDSGQLTLYTQFISDAIGIDDAVEDGILPVTQIQNMLHQDMQLMCKIVAAAYLLGELDLHGNNLLLMCESSHRLLAKIDHDHSLDSELCKTFFPLPIRLSDTTTLFEHLCGIKPCGTAGFLNWYPQDYNFKRVFTKYSAEQPARISPKEQALLNQAALDIFAQFKALSRDQIHAMVRKDFPPELLEVIGETSLSEIEVLIASRAENALTVLPVLERSSSVEAALCFGTPRGTEDTPTSVAASLQGSSASPQPLSFLGAATGKPHNPDLLLSTPLVFEDPAFSPR